MCKDSTVQKIGIMGGTFNPIHNGHLLLAENARNQYQLDKIYFIPTGPSPHKSDKQIAPAAIRYKMVELAISDNPGFMASSIEIDSAEISYTYRTLEKLHEKYPGNQFYFIMGGDSVYDFSGWRKPERICELAHLLVAVRDDMDLAKLTQYADMLRRKFQAEIHLLNTPNFSVSSHEIRKRILDGDSVRYLIPDAVRSYINEQQLYR